MNKQVRKYKIVFNPENEKEGIDLISFVKTPAIEVKGMCFSKETENLFQFKQVEDKMIVVAPAMIPNIELYRKDEQGGYYVSFSKEVIFEMMKKFNSQFKDFKFNVDHKEIKAPAYILESWIKEDDVFDKSLYYGFETLPVGTWLVSAQITDKEFWETEIKKNGKQGFSIEGFMGVSEIKLEKAKMSTIAGLEFEFEAPMLTKGTEVNLPDGEHILETYMKISVQNSKVENIEELTKEQKFRLNKRFK